MGVICEINVFKSDNEEFRPGDEVSGLIRYAVDDTTVFHKITVSLKGHGRLRIVNTERKHNREYTNKEEYVDIDNVIVGNENLLLVSKGNGTKEYETKFSFKLPEDIPPSYVYCSNKGGYYIKCKILYYIRIKFKKCGVLPLPKRFKKEITVGTAFKPTLPKSPVIYGEQRKIVKLFPSNNTISIKADIENSVIKCGEIVTFGYEILNNTHVELKGVKVKLVEVHSFKAKGLHRVKKVTNIEESTSRTPAIQRGGTQKLDFAIVVPVDRKTMQHSSIASIDYFIRIKVLLPMFRQNFTLDIPIEVGDEMLDEAVCLDAPPPSYWEVMGECEKRKIFGDDDYETDDDI
ncbi:uncharacterized protein LOC131849523 [Achroia grisella]|uniref:uncharacterized protein LOC131849523 n=1 Tax=Achroia grisella TaxID=688607 RepID=UPI0027D2B23E|nr:uncharacterized protein LOC131849523 [Achroia grisella]